MPKQRSAPPRTAPRCLPAFGGDIGGSHPRSELDVRLSGGIAPSTNYEEEKMGRDLLLPLGIILAQAVAFLALAGAWSLLS